MMVAFGITFAQSGFALPQLEDPEIGFAISKEEGSWFASILIIGCMFGSTLGGCKSEILGRKRSILIDCISYMIITFVLSLASNFYVLLAARLLLGFVSSSAMVSLLMYSGEITQPQVRQITGPFSGIFFAFGCSLGLAFGAMVSWRWAFALGNIVPLFSAIIMIFSPESPVWLLTQKEESAARKSLEKLRGKINTDIIDADISRIKINIEVDDEENHIEKPRLRYYNKLKKTMNIIIDPSFFKPFLVILLLLSNLDWGGIVPAQFYVVPILKNAKVPLDAYWIAPILAFTRVIFGTASIFIAKKLKQRPIYFISVSFMGLATLMLSIYSYFNLDGALTLNYPVAKWIPVLSVFLMQAACGFGTGTIPYTLLSELLPVHAKSLGQGLMGIIEYFSLFLSVKTVPTLVNYLGMHGNFFLSFVANVITIVVSYFIMPETSGLTLEEIEDLYRPASKKRFASNNNAQ